jgi:hypothetical protein
MGRLDAKSTKMRSLKFILLVGMMLTGTSLFAHVGSPGVIFQGKAGAYTVMVNINPPDVIPGTASISVYMGNQPVDHISMQPVYWYAGDKGSPKEDEAFPVTGSPGQYQATVWLMQSGVASMRIMVEGPMGKGSVIVPVMAISTAQRTMPASLDWTLAALGLLLVILMITIISASVSDGVLSPGADVRVVRKKKYRAVAITAIILFAILYGGAAWWNSWSSNYLRFLYKSPLAHTSVSTNGSQTILRMSIDTAWLRKNYASMSYLIPDHGKLMHLFLIREKTDDVFAHLHPTRVDSTDFEVALPDLPTGRYRVFGDIVHRDGFTETISDTVTIPSKLVASNPTGGGKSFYVDPDDTYITSNAINNNNNPFTGKSTLICGKPGVEMKLADGSTATWQHAANSPFEANKIYPLTFAIKDSTGQPAKLQPYMGMMGHAVILKYDGSVYIHLHPVGTYSMASQEIIQDRIKKSGKAPQAAQAKVFRDSIDRVISSIRSMTEDERNIYLNAAMKGMPMQAMTSADHMEGMVTFPYAFPSPGSYRIWVQMKHNGKILNSAFDAVVQ